MAQMKINEGLYYKSTYFSIKVFSVFILFWQSDKSGEKETKQNNSNEKWLLYNVIRQYNATRIHWSSCRPYS